MDLRNVRLWVLASLGLWGSVACGSSDEADSDADEATDDGGPGSDADGSDGSDDGATGGDTPPAAMEGMLEDHNAARAGVDPAPATPLSPLSWSREVASAAQSHADKCVFQHSSGSGYGENIYASSGSSSAADVVRSWVSEEEDYDYESNGCSGVCGHYTQVVWASSERLGCGVADCNQNSPFGGGSWQLWVCNYDPPGNFSGRRPY